jgi:hypothetical protein
MKQTACKHMMAAYMNKDKNKKNKNKNKNNNNNKATKQQLNL